MYLGVEDAKVSVMRCGELLDLEDEELVVEKLNVELVLITDVPEPGEQCVSRVLSVEYPWINEDVGDVSRCGWLVTQLVERVTLDHGASS